MNHKHIIYQHCSMDIYIHTRFKKNTCTIFDTYMHTIYVYMHRLQNDYKAPHEIIISHIDASHALPCFPHRLWYLLLLRLLLLFSAHFWYLKNTHTYINHIHIQIHICLCVYICVFVCFLKLFSFYILTLISSRLATCIIYRSFIAHFCLYIFSVFFLFPSFEATIFDSVCACTDLSRLILITSLFLSTLPREILCVQFMYMYVCAH